ncbi:unnamed protein product [Pylaiella littoralis]
MKGQLARNNSESKRRRVGSTRLGLRCLVIPCLVFAQFCGVGTSLRWQLFRETSEVPSVRGAAALEAPDVPEVVGFAEGGQNDPAAPVVAFAISITSLELPRALPILDAAEVLLHSIQAACELSRYRCETVAFAHSSIGPEGLQHLENMGWRVMEKDLPVALEEIEDENYRNHVVKSGCCGEKEFLKLHAYTLTDYHRVVHLDTDTLIFHPMDELMESAESLLYTTDPAMNMPGSRELPVQGGFLLVRPDLRVYDELRAIIRKGDWKTGTGWGGSNIGYCWGGATIQGLLPYYYHDVAPGTAKELNRCIYNHMSDSDECRRKDRYAVLPSGTEADASPILAFARRQAEPGEQGGAGGTTTPDAAASGVSAIKSVHFTQSCMKPWHCSRPDQNEGSCPLLQQAWSETRSVIMSKMGLPVTETCEKGIVDRDLERLKSGPSSPRAAVALSRPITVKVVGVAKEGARRDGTGAGQSTVLKCFAHYDGLAFRLFGENKDNLKLISKKAMLEHIRTKKSLRCARIGMRCSVTSLGCGTQSIRRPEK